MRGVGFLFLLGVCMPGSKPKGLAKISSRGRTTIPEKKREAANLREDDLIAFEVVNDHVVLRKVVPAEASYLRSLSEVLNEWICPEDDEAWRDL